MPTILLVPFLLNYLSGWYIWYQLDERKAYTWPVPLVALYPQMRAGMAIKELWKNSKKGLVKIRRFERDMNEAEVFLESIPTSSYWATYKEVGYLEPISSINISI